MNHVGKKAVCAKRKGVFCGVVSSVPWRKARSVTWPVGQAVKTAASHAANMGSIPVRVTTSKQASDYSLPRKRESSFPPVLFLSEFKQVCLNSEYR